MNNFPTYDSNFPRQYYDSFGEKEWTRLSKDAARELLYHVHRDVLRCYVHKEASLLELGAGTGMFSKELVGLAAQLVDILQPARETGNNFRRAGDMNLENHSTYSMLDMLFIVQPYDSIGRC
jgi:hypothetical protein